MSWKTLRIPCGESTIFCNSYITGKSAMNIVVTHTPVCTTLALQPAYEPLAKYGVNVFAIDFSGSGQSGGKEKDFSIASVINDLNYVVDYIEENYSSNIHLYGNGGIGGMFAQCFACSTDRIKSFAQFACVDYKNTAGVGYPYAGVKIMSWLLGHLLNFHITMKPPKYKGFNWEQDNGFYEKMQKDIPGLFRTSTKITNAMLESVVSPDSPARNGVRVPTLVFKTLHDRYFSPEYFDHYFASLSCKKKLIEIDDVHNSYYIHAEEFCKAVYEWFVENL